MALISKMNRCAVCGSSEVVYDSGKGLYHCPACGGHGLRAILAAGGEIGRAHV